MADTATGTLVSYIPKGSDRDELLGLVRMGVIFRSQQVGKRPGELAHLVLECARRGGSPFTFEKLLDKLENEAARREIRGEAASPVEQINRVWQLATIHMKTGREHIPFGTLRNHLTKAKKILRAGIPT